MANEMGVFPRLVLLILQELTAGKLPVVYMKAERVLLFHGTLLILTIYLFMDKKIGFPAK
jgi:hypothetical protein